MMGSATVDWQGIAALAEQTSHSSAEPGSIPESAWHKVDEGLRLLRASGDLEGIIRLRNQFTALFAHDTLGGLDLLQRLDAEAINAARRIGNQPVLAHLLGARGHNLHRQGHHRSAIAAFEESANLYRQVGNDLAARKSFYMTALCYRALGDLSRARRTLDQVLQEVESDDPWRGEPLQVLGWLAQDEGRLAEAESLFRDALRLLGQGNDSDILVAGALVDLAEVVGLQNRIDQARILFQHGLMLIRKHGGQYQRQEARTLLKLAELELYIRQHGNALSLLDEADDQIRMYGSYYDLLWRIELARARSFLHQFRLHDAYRKWRSALRYRRLLSLPTSLLLSQLLRRWRTGSGPPR